VADPTLGADATPDADHGRHLRVAFAIYGVLLVVVLMVLSLLAQSATIELDPIAPLVPAEQVTATGEAAR
jgi:hypothetical protein